VTVHLGDMVAPLVDGQLGDDRRDRALAHIAQCADCQREVATHRRLKARLSALGGPELPPGAVNRLLGLPAATLAERLDSAHPGFDGAPLASAPCTAVPARVDRPGLAVARFLGPRAAVPGSPAAGPAAAGSPVADEAGVDPLVSPAALRAHLDAAAMSGRSGSVFPASGRGAFATAASRRPGFSFPALPALPVRRASLVPPGGRAGHGGAGHGDDRHRGDRVVFGVGQAIGAPPGPSRVGADAEAGTRGVRVAERAEPAGATAVARPPWRAEPAWTVRRTVLGSAAALALVMAGGVALAGGPPASGPRSPAATPASVSFVVTRGGGEAMVVPAQAGLTGGGAFTSVPISFRR
jgi:hypothetical protein